MFQPKNTYVSIEKSMPSCMHGHETKDVGNDDATTMVVIVMVEMMVLTLMLMLMLLHADGMMREKGNQIS